MDKSRGAIMLTYRNIIQRCYSPIDKKYRYYGGKGITVCPEWLERPILFVIWSKENGWEKGKHIHRKKNEEGYNPENCTYLSPEEHRSQHPKKGIPKQRTKRVVRIKGRLSMKKNVVLPINFSEEEYEKLRTYAFEARASMSKVVRESVVQYLFLKRSAVKIKDKK